MKRDPGEVSRFLRIKEAFESMGGETVFRQDPDGVFRPHVEWPERKAPTETSSESE